MAVRMTVMSQPGIRFLDLHRGKADDVYLLIVTDQIYVDVSKTPLADHEHVQVFLDRAAAESYLAQQASCTHLPCLQKLEVPVGAPVMLDGKRWTILNPGETEVLFLSEDKHLMAVPNAACEEMIRTSRLTGLSSPTVEPRQEEARALLRAASPAALEQANRRYGLITARTRDLPASSGGHVPERTLRRWRALFRAAEVAYGNGFVGLLPKWSTQGNRLSRLDEQTEALLETFITTHYETLKQQPKREVYLLLSREAEHKHLPVPSYTTFLTRIKQRPRLEQTRKRQGPRAAAQVEPWYWELERTTPRHGDRPWDIVHMDHTLLDIELVSARTGRPLGRPWATFMTDAFSRRLLVVYLTFDPPSYRSCMMVLRECVCRYGRLPHMTVVDGGSDFRSTYFETLLAYYGCIRATRPWAKPRYGSVFPSLVFCRSMTPSLRSKKTI